MFYATVRKEASSLPQYSNSPTSILMKNASKLFLIAFGAALLSLPALRAEDPAPAGGPPPPPPEHREKFRKEMKEREEHMAKELGLSADQQTKWKAIGDEARTAGEAIRADNTLTKEQRREKMTQLMQDTKAKHIALLNPEQQKKMEEFIANHPEGGPRHKKDKGEAAPAAPEAK